MKRDPHETSPVEAQVADYVRNYAVTLQVVLTVIGDEETDWEDIEANVEDTGSYTLLTPFESDVIAVIRSAQ